MNYVLIIKDIDSSERKVDMRTSDKEEAISRANKYTRGGESIIEYAYLSNGTTLLEFSFTSTFLQGKDEPMNFYLTFKTIDGEEQEIDMRTSNLEEALHIAYQYTRGGEGIVEYASLSNGDMYLEHSYSSCAFE